MAVKPFSRQWGSLLQRGLDSASEAADVVAHRLSLADSRPATCAAQNGPCGSR